MTSSTTGPLLPPADRREPTASELSHASIGQWGGVIAGALAGFAATVVLATLGTAIGLTAGAVAFDAADVTGDRAAGAFGVGALLWLVVSAIAVGLVGGSVLARSARPDRSYHPGTLGLVTWTAGIVLAALVAAPAAMGVMSGVGGAAGFSAADARIARATPVGFRADDVVRPADAAASTRGTTDAERARMRVAAEDATRAATSAAWAALLAQILSLGATILAAKWQRRRVVEIEPVGYAMPRS